MTFPLKELAKLLTPEEVIMGVVVGMVGGTIKVATSKGAVPVAASGVLNVGDRVSVVGGIATKAPVPSQSFMV